jgi:nicotinamide-nucleotide amidase
MFPPELLSRAVSFLDLCRARDVKIVTAESCTGGLIAGLLTEIAGSSDVVERGFVTYSNAAKTDCLGVPADLIDKRGAVSREVAAAMAQGALEHSRAGIAVAVTGVAGPDGGTASKPVGLVYIAARSRSGQSRVEEHCFDEALGRSGIRLATIAAALDLAEQVMT